MVRAGLPDCDLLTHYMVHMIIRLGVDMVGFSTRFGSLFRSVGVESALGKAVAAVSDPAEDTDEDERDEEEDTGVSGVR